jgi:hypothetical protein
MNPMPTVPKVLTVLIIALFFTSPSTAKPPRAEAELTYTLLMVDNQGQLRSVDQRTAAVSAPIALDPPTSLWSVAFDPTHHVLYGQAGSRLLAIDWTNWQATTIGDLQPPDFYWLGGMLAYDTTTDTLFTGLGPNQNPPNPSPELGKIDLATLQVSDTGTQFWYAGSYNLPGPLNMAADTTGTVWVTDSQFYVEGWTVKVVHAGQVGVRSFPCMGFNDSCQPDFKEIEALAFRPDNGEMWAACYGISPLSLCIVNPHGQHLQATKTIGPLHVDPQRGMAFIPEMLHDIPIRP